MKRKIFFIVASILMYGSTYAQNHYNFNPRDYQFNLGIVAQIKINGVEQTSNDLELGAFNGESIRGSQRIGQYGSAGYYRAIIQIYGNPIETNYEVTFKLYNHSSGEELDNCDISYLGEPYTILWTAPHAIGNNSKPVVLNFVTMQTFKKPITAYTSNKDHYYLIASPIGTVSPENVTNMLSNSYDLYRFNQSAPANDQGITLDWENYKQEGDNYHFNLEPSKGYLYANSGNGSDDLITLTFTGTPIEGTTYKIPLVKDDAAKFAGWNLVGNPFAQTAYIGNRSFYVMNDDGTEITTSEANSIAPMEGIFVIANTDGEELTFSTTRTARQRQQLVINVMHNRGNAIDRAIVRFDEESTLPKFQLNPNHTKVYIPQGGQDFAVVHSEGIGELPFNFKAEKNGTYTLSFSNEEVTFSYLHLIDNITGADVDLIQQSNYSFNARTSDNASRFRLVFAADGTSGDTCEPDFAYFNGSSWTISNMGEATLQVVDMMGRVLSSEIISGNTEININQPAGVYMLRLIDNENVRVQKVVVR